jgi:hypothetical protein
VQAGSVLALLSVLGAAPTIAAAQPRVTTLEGDGWSDVVSDLAEQVASEGAQIALCVRDREGGACLPCGRYTLAFDGAASQAFAIGACDEATGATSVRLAHRSALFDHTHAVPVPRPLSITARLARGSITESATPRSVGTAVGCSVRVRPYVRDLEHGVVVFLHPDAYEVRVAQARLRVDPSIDGTFVISSTDGVTTEVAYDVVDRATGTVIVVGHTVIECASTVDVPATEPGAVSPTAVAPRLSVAPMLAADALVVGSGIRVAPHDTVSDAGSAMVVTGLAIATASALTLLGIGLASGVQATPDCIGPYTGTYAHLGGGSSRGATRGCSGWGPPHATSIPAELTWGVVGALGVGVVLGAIGGIIQQTRPRGPDVVRIALDVGPNGGQAGVTVAF